MSDIKTWYLGDPVRPGAVALCAYSYQTGGSIPVISKDAYDTQAAQIELLKRASFAAEHLLQARIERLKGLLREALKWQTLDRFDEFTDYYEFVECAQKELE